MLARLRQQEFAGTLALCLALFGGLGLGIGNAVQLLSDGEVFHGGAHHGAATHSEEAGQHHAPHHHAGHRPAPDAEHQPEVDAGDADDPHAKCGDGAASVTSEQVAEHGVDPLPAHCFFCLDGVTPALPELDAPTPIRTAGTRRARAQATVDPLPQRVAPAPLPRGPPTLV